MNVNTRRAIVVGMEILSKAEKHFMDSGNDSGVAIRSQDKERLKKLGTAVRDVIFQCAEMVKLP